MMASIMPFDELNQLEAEVQERFGSTTKVFNDDLEDILDMLLDLFLVAVEHGVKVTNEALSGTWKPDVDYVMGIINRKVADKTWRERVTEYFTKAEDGEIRISGSEDQNASQEAVSAPTGELEKGMVSLTEAINRIAETEMHRIANTAALDAAERAGAEWKTWITMMDDRVRESHDYLEGMTVEIGEDFYTWDGNHAPAPGMFGVPEEDINCRCELLFSR